MKKIIFTLIFVCAAFIAALSSSKLHVGEVKQAEPSRFMGAAIKADSESQDATSTTPEVIGPSLMMADKTFKVLLSDTPELRQKGLSGRASLLPDEAMVFIFDFEDKHGFWMKDMNFPIDIAWLDAAQRLVAIEHNVSPASYPKTFYPAAPAKYVIETVSGTFASLDIHIGDMVVLKSGK